MKPMLCAAIGFSRSLKYVVAEKRVEKKNIVFIACKDWMKFIKCDDSMQFT